MFGDVSFLVVVLRLLVVIFDVSIVIDMLSFMVDRHLLIFVVLRRRKVVYMSRYMVDGLAVVIVSLSFMEHWLRVLVDTLSIVEVVVRVADSVRNGAHDVGLGRITCSNILWGGVEVSSFFDDIVLLRSCHNEVKRAVRLVLIVVRIVLVAVHILARHVVMRWVLIMMACVVHGLGVNMLVHFMGSLSMVSISDGLMKCNMSGMSNGVMLSSSLMDGVNIRVSSDLVMHGVSVLMVHDRRLNMMRGSLHDGLLFFRLCGFLGLRLRLCVMKNWCIKVNGFMVHRGVMVLWSVMHGRVVSWCMVHRSSVMGRRGMMLSDCMRSLMVHRGIVMHSCSVMHRSSVMPKCSVDRCSSMMGGCYMMSRSVMMSMGCSMMGRLCMVSGRCVVYLCSMRNSNVRVHFMVRNDMGIRVLRMSLGDLFVYCLMLWCHCLLRFVVNFLMVDGLVVLNSMVLRGVMLGSMMS